MFANSYRKEIDIPDTSTTIDAVDRFINYEFVDKAQIYYVFDCNSPNDPYFVII